MIFLRDTGTTIFSEWQAVAKSNIRILRMGFHAKSENRNVRFDSDRNLPLGMADRV